MHCYHEVKLLCLELKCHLNFMRAVKTYMYGYLLYNGLNTDVILLRCLMDTTDIWFIAFKAIDSYQLVKFITINDEPINV